MSGQANFRPDEERPIDGVFMFEKILKVVGVVVGAIVVIIAVFAAVRLMRFADSAYGAEVAEKAIPSMPEVWRATDASGRVVVRAFKSVRCPVAGGWLTKVFRGERIVEGKKLRACWFGTDDQKITFIDEAGGVSYFPATSFEQEVPGD